MSEPELYDEPGLEHDIIGQMLVSLGVSAVASFIASGTVAIAHELGVEAAATAVELAVGTAAEAVQSGVEAAAQAVGDWVQSTGFEALTVGVAGAALSASYDPSQGGNSNTSYDPSQGGYPTAVTSDMQQDTADSTCNMENAVSSTSEVESDTDSGPSY